MNYLNPQLRDALAAEYVLGTLRGGARRRFQRLMLQYPSVRESAWLWEQQLYGLNDALTPIEPDAKVWRSIRQQLGFDSAEVNEQVSSSPNTYSSKDQKVVDINSSTNRIWQGLAALATAATIFMAVLLFDTQSSDFILPQQIAVMQSEQAETLWLIEVNEHTIDVLATSKLSPAPNKDFELWMVAKDVENPISLGLLPKSGKVSLPKHAQFDAMDIVALAVSIEPLNGSPNGLPSKVLYTAQLAVL
ncbi:MAG: anti-sigma-K factor RskA [Oleiphilaceae bacterium]|jgi:anti-sigma-K factor RskA